MLRSSTFAALPYSLGNGLIQYANENEAKREEMLPRIQQVVAQNYEKLYLPLEIDVLADELHLYAEKGGDIAPYIRELGIENDNNFQNVIENAFENSVFASAEKLHDYLTNPKAETITSDP